MRQPSRRIIRLKRSRAEGASGRSPAILGTPATCGITSVSAAEGSEAPGPPGPGGAPAGPGEGEPPAERPRAAAAATAPVPAPAAGVALGEVCARSPAAAVGSLRPAVAPAGAPGGVALPRGKRRPRPATQPAAAMPITVGPGTNQVQSTAECTP